MNEPRLKERLTKIAADHKALWVDVKWCQGTWRIDLELLGMAGTHRIGVSRSLRRALRQAEAAVPGSTIPLQVNGSDHQTCVTGGCSHFRVAHSDHGCRQPGCPCTAFTRSRP